MSIDVIGNDNTIVYRTEPAGHNDTNATGMIQPFDLFGQAPTDREAFEFSAETGSVLMLSVMGKSPWCRCFGKNDPLSRVGHVFLECPKSGLNELLFTCYIFLVVQMDPVVPVGVGARHN